MLTMKGKIELEMSKSQIVVLKKGFFLPLLLLQYQSNLSFSSK